MLLLSCCLLWTDTCSNTLTIHVLKNRTVNEHTHILLDVSSHLTDGTPVITVFQEYPCNDQGLQSVPELGIVGIPARLRVCDILPGYVIPGQELGYNL